MNKCSNRTNTKGAPQVLAYTHLVRDCAKSLNTPNFSWGFFNFGLRRSARSLPRCYSFPLASRGKRDIKTKRDLLLRRRLTLKIPQLKKP
jgi:hypothetical protein